LFLQVYLAKDCVEKAISSLQMRVKESHDKEQEQLDSGRVDELEFKKTPLPFALHMQDFDVEKISKSEQDVKKKEVDAKIKKMVGWGSKEEEHSPKWWFETQRQILQRQQQVEEEEQEGMVAHVSESKTGMGMSTGMPTGSDNQQAWDFNVIVEGSSGSGKQEFAMIAAEFLHAYGKLKNQKLVVQTSDTMIPDSYGTMDEATQKAVGVFDAARNEKDAALMIKELEKLTIGGAQGGDMKAATISQLKSVGQVIVNESEHAPFVVLSCEQQTYRSVITIHNQMSARFPHHVILQDPDCESLIAVCQDYSNAKNVKWSNDLYDKVRTELFVCCGGCFNLLF